MREQLYFYPFPMLSISFPESIIKWPWKMLEPTFSREFILFPFTDVIAAIVVFYFPDSLDLIILPLAFIAVNKIATTKS